MRTGSEATFCQWLKRTHGEAMCMYTRWKKKYTPASLLMVVHTSVVIIFTGQSTFCPLQYFSMKPVKFTVKLSGILQTPTGISIVVIIVWKEQKEGFHNTGIVKCISMGYCYMLYSKKFLLKMFKKKLKYDKRKLL